MKWEHVFSSMQSHIVILIFADEYYDPSFARKNVDITEDEEGVAVIQIHVRGVMQP